MNNYQQYSFIDNKFKKYINNDLNNRH